MAFAKSITVETVKAFGHEYVLVVPDNYLPKVVKETLRSNGFRFDWDLKAYKARKSDATVQTAAEVKRNVETYALTHKREDMGVDKGTKATPKASVASIAEQAKELLGLGFSKAQVAKMIGEAAAKA